MCNRTLLTTGVTLGCIQLTTMTVTSASAAVQMGAFALTPELTFTEIHDSNYYRQSDNADAFWWQRLNLRLLAETTDGPNKFSGLYQLDAGYIDASPDDNYTDQLASIAGLWHLSSRQQLDLKSVYREDHDRRGTEYFEGGNALQLDSPARYRLESMHGGYAYGAEDALGRLEFALKATNKTYLNHREFTERNDLLDLNGRSTFLWRLAGTLRGLVEIQGGKTDYYHDPVLQDGTEDTLDSTYITYLAGVTWKLAGKTRGTLKAGYANKYFVDPDRQDFSGASWSGAITWMPLTYSTVQLGTSRHAEESTGDSDFIDVADWSADWRHEWNDQLTSRLRYRRSHETYQGHPQQREDVISRYDAALDYEFRRWIAMGLFCLAESHDSNLAEYDYPRNVAGVRLHLTL